MQYLVLEEKSARSRVLFIHYKADHIPSAHKEKMVAVEELEEQPKVQPHQTAVLYANGETGEHWWEVEDKQMLTKYEFYSMLGADNRILLNDLAKNDTIIADAMFMLSIQGDTVQMDSEEVKTILSHVEI